MKNFLSVILCFFFVVTISSCARVEITPTPAPDKVIVDPDELDLDPASACCTCGEGLLEGVPAKPGCGYPCCYIA